MVKWIKANWLHLLTIGLTKAVEYLKKQKVSNN